MAKQRLYDITIVLPMWERWRVKEGLSMEEMAAKYGYRREWKLYQKGIIVRDGEFVNLDGSPVTPGKVGPNVAKTKAPRAAVAPDAPKSDSRTPRPVLQYTLSGEFVKEWPSMMEAERNGFCHGNVSPCCLGRRKSAYGYIWKFKD
jgi:hypothetical protein